jgi:hypothetical protein
MKTSLLLALGIHLMWGMTSCVSNVEEELYPPDTCDTVSVTYAATIAPIIVQNCFDCHQGAGSISGIPLDGYENLKAMVDAGRLVGALRRLNGFSPMPKDAAALPECDLVQIEKWVNEGAPDN